MSDSGSFWEDGALRASTEFMWTVATDTLLEGSLEARRKDDLRNTDIKNDMKEVGTEPSPKP